MRTLGRDAIERRTRRGSSTADVDDAGTTAYLIAVESAKRSVDLDAHEPRHVRKDGTMNQSEAQGLVETTTPHSVDETVQRIVALLEEKGVTLFALVDHSGEAAKVGLTMRPTKLLIFGNPKAGTPVMIAAPSSALDLPLKLLVAEGADGKVRITYNSPRYLQERHGIPAELLQNVALVAALAGSTSK